MIPEFSVLLFANKGFILRAFKSNPSYLKDIRADGQSYKWEIQCLTSGFLRIKSLNFQRHIIDSTILQHKC